MNIRTKLLAIFIPLVVISIGLGGVLNILHFKSLSRESAEITERIENLRHTADQASERIGTVMDSRALADFTFISRQIKTGFENRISNLAKMLDIIARSPLVGQYMTQPGTRGKIEAELRAYLDTAIGNYNLLGASILDDTGRVLLRQSSRIIPDTGGTPLDAAEYMGGDDLGDSAWFASRLEESKFMHLLAGMRSFGGLGEVPVADLSCPLKYNGKEYSPYTGTVRGYFLLTINVRDLTGSILIPRADFNWRLYLTDASDRILVSTDEGSVGKPFHLSIEEKKTNYAISQKIFRGKLAFHLLTSKDQFKEGSRIINDLSGSISREAAAAGKLAGTIDRSISESLKQVALITIAALLASLLVILGSAGRISRSLERLAQSANRIAAGNLEVRPESVAGDPTEVVELTRSLDDMRANLKIHIEHLNQAEKKYRNIFENAMEGIFQATPDGRFINANPALAHILGYIDPEELIRPRANANNLMFAEPETFERFLKILKRLGRIANFMAQFKHRDGKTFWGAVSARYVSDGVESYIEGTMEDITKRKSAEEASRKFKFIADASKDFMTLINRDYVYEAVNKAYCEIRGLPEYRIVGRSVGDVWGEGMFNREIKKHIDRCLEGEFVDYEAPIAFQGTTQVFHHVFYSPYRNDRGEVTHAVVVSRDISRRKKAEALEREKVAAEAASKAKSDFLASMSHEIRTPMNAILGMAELLSESPLSEEDRNYVRIVRGAGENLLDLINDILDLSKVEAGRLELERIAFDPRKMLKDTVEFMAFRAREKGLEMNSSVEDTVPQRIVGDPTRLRQILVNLAGNAVKFTEQGQISIAVTGGHANDGRPELMFEVRDTGVGIPENKLATIFESYTQAEASTTRKYGGTGLGLTISRKLVDLMDGRIWAESAPGGGTSFRFTARFDAAPVQEAPESGPADTADETRVSPPSPPSRPLRILLAEDNENNRVLFKFYLKKTDHAVDEAVNGVEAVERFKNAEYDMVFMDIEMPELDGHDATRAIREWEREQGRTPRPIIALTAHALKGVEKESHEAGCTGHMTKPFKKNELLEAIERYAPAN